MEADYLTFAQAAKELGVHRTAIYDAVTAGKLPAVRVMGKQAIRRGDLAAYTPRPNKRRWQAGHKPAPQVVEGPRGREPQR